MRNALALAFIFICTWCSAQVIDNNGPNADTLDFNSDTIPFHYPYFGKRIPPFIAVSGGVEGYQNYCWEAGVIAHIAEYYDEDHARGQMFGFGLTYKQSFHTDLKTLELEGGIYTALTIGFGFNENFYEGTRTFGFRPFIGTSWYHFQLMAGYNCYSKRQSDLAELNHFTIKIRYVIPVVRIFRAIPNPGNNY